MEIFMGFCGKMAVAQSGGPTAAINATLYGVIAEAIKENVEIFGAENGIKGMMEKKITHLNPIFSDKENCELLKLTPAAFLGSCRYKLPDTLEKNEVYESIFDTFFENDIKYFIYIGGNDSMDTVSKLAEYSDRHKKGVSVVGVPKTIDNDLAGTDHTPGFGSAAKFVAAAVKEIARDSAVYAEKSVTVIEIMGRNAGWLTAASALARCSTSSAPHLIYLPERPVSRKKLVSDLRGCDERNIIVAVSEGVKDENNEYYSNDEASAHDIFGHAQLAGAAGVLAKLYKKEFNYKTRGIELSIPQRSSSHFASLTDLRESEMIGAAGARAALSGKNGAVMGFRRKNQYEIEIVENKAKDIANLERFVPDEFIADSGNDVTDAYIKYARPLIMGEPRLIYEDGLPKHIALHNFLDRKGG